MTILDPGPVPDTVLPRLVATVRRSRRRRRRWTAAGGVAAAACLAADVVLGMGGLGTTPAVSTAGMTMTQVRPVPVQATLRLQEMPWGTRLKVNCEYEGTNPRPADTEQLLRYKLVVVPLGSGKPQQVATWGVEPGRDAEPTGSTDLTLADIRVVRLETNDGTVLLRAAPG
ncbi:MAG: hypothetical protein ACRDMV_00130 [Streptosporangiales bacterium]